MKIKSIVLLIVCSISFNIAFSQSYVERNVASIKTVQLFNTTQNTHTPFISFQDYFVVSFDDIQSSYQRYFYTIKHYDKNWNESDLMASEYIKGYFSDEIRTYTASFNTLQPYVHYEFQFPNDKISPKISGNYALIVYTKDAKNPVFTRRFCVYENTASLAISQEMANAGSQDKPNQRLFVTSSGTQGFSLNDVQNYSSLTLIQNNNFSTAIQDIKPQFVLNNQLKFTQSELVFYGGNEFYMFDTKNVQINGLTTQEIKQNKLYEHYLYPTEIFPLEYAFNQDINGEYYIRRNDVGQEREASLEGDYVWVNVAVYLEKDDEAELFVVGAFTNFQLNEEYKLQWNEEGFYEKSMLLKQGYYNYQIIVKSKNSSQNPYDLTGNFWQTKNQYTALLYFSDFQNRYDRLLGIGNLWQNFF